VQREESDHPRTEKIYNILKAESLQIQCAVFMETILETGTEATRSLKRKLDKSFASSLFFSDD